MVSNRHTLLMLITSLCLTASASLWAQNAEPRFVQRLTWVGDGYATRYEVIIERDEDGQYKRALRQFTTDFFIEVSLPPGRYRFQVIPYDYLNLPVPVTEWMNFVIQRAVINPEKPESKDEVQFTALHSEESESENEITAPDPEPGTTVKNRTSFNTYLGLAWIPSLPIYGGNESSGETPSPYGAGLRLAIVSAEQSRLNLGVEGSSAWRFFPGDPSTHSLTFDLNVLARVSNDKAALNFRMGLGLSLYIGADQASAVAQTDGHTNFGISILWLSLKHLYLEGGVEYVQSFAYSGFLHPSVILGFRF